MARSPASPVATWPRVRGMVWATHRENASRPSGILPASTTMTIPASRTRCGRHSSPTLPSGTGRLERSAHLESGVNEEPAEDLQARLFGLRELAAHVDVRSHVGVPAQRVLALPLRHLQVDTGQYCAAFAHARTDDGGWSIRHSHVHGQDLRGEACCVPEIEATATVG